MRKSTITRIWLTGVIAMVAGFVVAGISVGVMLTNGGSYTPAPSGSGYDFTPALNSVFWTSVGFIVIGGVAAIAGGIAQLVAWVGALVNTYPLQDRTWFVVLLVGGVLSLAVGLAQIAVMIAYVIAGPDGAEPQRADLPMQSAPLARPTSLAHS